MQEKLENNKKLRHIAFEAMKHEGGPSNVGPHGATVGGGATSGPNESSSDEEVYFQSTSTLNAPNSEPAQPLLPLWTGACMESPPLIFIPNSSTLNTLE